MFEETEVRAMGRTASGVRGMKLEGDAKLVDLSTDQYGDKVFALSENGLGKISNIEDYRLTKRGAGGVITIKINEKTGNLIGMKVINGDEDYIVITNNGTVIRSPISQVRVCGRNSSGVRIINLREKESVSSFAVLPKEEEVETESTTISQETTTENPAVDGEANE